MEVANKGGSYLPGDPMLIDNIVYELKSQGIFDQFRKECIANVDTKPAYQNLRQRVEGSVIGFLRKQKWTTDMNKNQLREMLRKNISESGFLETGVERIVDQVVNPKINSIFLPQVEKVVYKYLGIEKETKSTETKMELEVKKEELVSKESEEIPAEASPLEKESEQKERNDNEPAEEQEADDSKNDEDESPPFEPIEESSIFAPPDDSVDSHLSIVSHDSNHSQDITSKIAGMDISNQDSQNSKQSSDSLATVPASEEDTKMDASDDSKSAKSKTDSGQQNVKTDKEKKSLSRHKSHEKRDKKEKDRRHSSSSHSKERSRSDNKSKSHSSSKPRDKSEKRHDSKTDSRKKESSSNSKGKEKDKDESKNKHKHSSSSSSSKSRRDDKSKDRDKTKEKEKSGKQESSHRHKNDKEKEEEKKKKDSKDDHYSYKDKKTNHRSTDGDSSDGHSGTHSSSGSGVENSSSQAKKTENSNETCTGDSSSGNSEQTDVPVSQIKLIKPKFASNIFEAKRLMKIRKKLKEIELGNSEIAVELNNSEDRELNSSDQVELDNSDSKDTVEESETDLLYFIETDRHAEAQNFLDFAMNTIKCLEEVIKSLISNLNGDLCEGITKSNLLDMSAQIDFTVSPRHGLKRNNNVPAIPEPFCKKTKPVENSVLVPVQCDFNLPLSPAESEKSATNDFAVVKKRIVKPAKKTQRYSSDDLYKPRLNFSSSRRSRVFKE